MEFKETKKFTWADHWTWKRSATQTKEDIKLTLLANYFGSNEPLPLFSMNKVAHVVNETSCLDGEAIGKNAHSPDEFIERKRWRLC